MDEQNERTEYTILGRPIGTATGWDHGDTFVVVLYEFEPVSRYDNIPKCDLSVDYENGKFSSYDENGKLFWEADMIEALK